VEAGGKKKRMMDDGRKRKKEEDDWVRSWVGETTINRIESIALTLSSASKRSLKGKRKTRKRVRSHRTIRLSMTTMTNLPCNNQPSCDSNVSMG